MHVLPSIIEGFSQTLLEAMAFNVPVIATRAAGNIDLIKNGWNGYLYENNHPQDLAQKIETILSSQPDLSHLVLRARKTATEDYNINQTVAGYEQLFHKLLQLEAMPLEPKVVRSTVSVPQP
jgi:glycosyltransferase involved in cell wall biosynthesis